MKIVLSISIILLVACQATFAGTVEEKSAFNLYIMASRNCRNPRTRALAVQQITEAMSLAPQNAIYIYQKAFYLSMSEEDDAEVLKLLNSALKIRKDMPEVWALKSEVLLRRGKPQEALECANQAVALHPKFFMCKLHSLKTLKRTEEALNESAKFLKRYPNHAVLTAFHSDMARRLKQWDTVIADETKMLNFCTPKEASYLSHLRFRAAAYIATKQDNRAIPDLQEVARRLPVDRQVHSDLLEIYKRKKDAKNIAKEEKLIRDLDSEM